MPDSLPAPKMVDGEAVLVPGEIAAVYKSEELGLERWLSS